jgi:hypothetical protein
VYAKTRKIKNVASITIEMYLIISPATKIEAATIDNSTKVSAAT